MLSQLHEAGRCVGPERRGGPLGVHLEGTAVGVQGSSEEMGVERM